MMSFSFDVKSQTNGHFSPGKYRASILTVGADSSVWSMDSIHLATDVSNIENGDVNHWNTTYTIVRDQFCSGCYVNAGNPYDNPTFVHTLFFNKLTSWPGSTSQLIRGDGSLATISTPTFNATPARVLSTTGSNNTFTISTTKPARVNYTVNFSIALLAAASNGIVTLDYSTDSGSTWITAGSVSQQYSVAITLTTNQDNNLSGEIPANALVRIYRSTATNCTVTLPTTKQQEVTY